MKYLFIFQINLAVNVKIRKSADPIEIYVRFSFSVEFLRVIFLAKFFLIGTPQEYMKA
jgi:hypothetical protein